MEFVDGLAVEVLESFVTWEQLSYAIECFVNTPVAISGIIKESA